MPGQFPNVIDSAVESPTTVAPSLKSLEEKRVPVRESRSSTLPRRASTASVLTVQHHQSDTFTEEEEREFQLQQSVRHARRALSSGTGSSLSLLQQELGYPRRARVAVDGHHHRHGSLLETALENTLSRRRNYNDRSNSNSSNAGSVSSSDIHRTQSVPEPEAENQIHHLQRGWTFHSISCTAAENSSEDDAVLEDEEDENFLDYRTASVTGYSCDTDGVVYYEVIVRSTAHGPLSAYKVRRRYSEFRELHEALSKVMPVSHKKLASIKDTTNTRDENNKTDEICTFNCSKTGEATLPPLPDKGGVWSYIQYDSIPLLERRAKYFNAMLLAAQQHPAARTSRLLNDFVGTPPDLVSMHSSVENSYVSLNRFAAPKLSFDIEIQERKEKAKVIRERRSSHRRQRSMDASFYSTCTA